MDAIELALLSGALAHACEEMGTVLIRAAHSPNIKERRDASTALFHADGAMVMQAEHIPVHLGAMPAAVSAVRRLTDGLGPPRRWSGSEAPAFILNDPYAGGTHLPDITVVMPVAVGDRVIGYSAARAHHADVGSPTPGSMPADSVTLADEGVVIAPQLLEERTLAPLVAQMRAPAQRRADLRAQLAACRIGAAHLRALSDRHGVDGLADALGEVLDYAERRTRAGVAALGNGVRTATDHLETAAGLLTLRLTATVEGDTLILDFSGTDPQHAGNLNCPLAVTVSACYFAAKVLTDPDIPACAGAYRPVRVIAPSGCLLNARAPAAVAAGNVETSSRVADLVLAAFGHALGQGTMNNLTLGDAERVYYETIGGGQAASATADGPSGIHVAMSNTLNTPIEALELDYPLLMVRYARRRGSGGAGAHRGGDGVIRELEALAPLTYSLISERRRIAPPGAAGGAAGAPGRNSLDGVELAAKCVGRIAPGERLRIETPGGGGYGAQP
jgi:N-methylhydantoinase B